MIFIKIAKIIVVLLCLTFYPFTLVKGIQISPRTMTISGADSPSIGYVYIYKQPLTVTNDQTDTRNFNVIAQSVTPKEGYEELPDTSWFSFNPSSFILGAGESKDVEITLTIPNDIDYMGRKFETRFKAYTIGTGSIEGVKCIVEFSVLP